MKKVGLGFVLALVLVVGGWAVARERAADQNASQYLTAREIPTYHALSFHGKGDSNLLGWCKPCGDKARAVIAAKVDKEVEETKRKLDEVLKGK